MTTSVKLNTQTGVPLYQQILVILRNQITSGDLVAGDKIMGETELCEAFNVSRITAQRALNELASQGFVERKQGQGTSVASNAVRAVAEPMRATLDGLFENVGHIGRTTTVRVLKSGYVPAPKNIAARLDVTKGDPVLHAVRVRDLSGQPMSLLNTWVPSHIGALIEGQDMSATPLLILLEEVGVQVASATQNLSATVADAITAGAVGVAAGAPLIDVRRVVFDTSGKPVEFIKILYRPELYSFEMSMRRVERESGKAWQNAELAR